MAENNLSISNQYRMRWRSTPSWGRIAGRIALVLLMVRLGWSVWIAATPPAPDLAKEFEPIHGASLAAKVNLADEFQAPTPAPTLPAGYSLVEDSPAPAAEPAFDPFKSGEAVETPPPSPKSAFDPDAYLAEKGIKVDTPPVAQKNKPAVDPDPYLAIVTIVTPDVDLSKYVVPVKKTEDHSSAIGWILDIGWIVAWLVFVVAFFPKARHAMAVILSCCIVSPLKFCLRLTKLKLTDRRIAYVGLLVFILLLLRPAVQSTYYDSWAKHVVNLGASHEWLWDIGTNYRGYQNYQVAVDVGRQLLEMFEIMAVTAGLIFVRRMAK